MRKYRIATQLLFSHKRFYSKLPTNYEIINTPHQQVPIKAWCKNLPIEPEAYNQLVKTAQLPIIHKWIAAMPDGLVLFFSQSHSLLVHWGIGATVGSVIPTKNAIIPAAVGVDIGCGMCAVKTSLVASDLPDSLKKLREAIEEAVPHGRTGNGYWKRDKGAFKHVTKKKAEIWRKELEPGFRKICAKAPQVEDANSVYHMGTLGTGNHFIEVCLDEDQNVWIMLHSGSRGVGNKIGTVFIELAKKDMRKHHFIRDLPDENLAYFKEGTDHFDDYVFAVEWAQKFARINRQLMMEQVIDALNSTKLLPPFTHDLMAVNCHHNYVQKEVHFGEQIFVTRKGAVRAGKGELGIIPGSMGARSYIVRGLGNKESFETCSHGAGRVISRNEAKRRFTIDDHIEATKGVECRKDAGVLDETPMAYKV